MRDLLFRNLTSGDRRKKVIASSEITDKQGIRSIVRRHFACLVKEVKDVNAHRPAPYLYVLKEHNNLEQRGKFFCRIKGSIYAIDKDKIYLVLFMHSLKISLETIPLESMKYTEGP